MGHNSALRGGVRATMVSPVIGAAANPAAGTVELKAGTAGPTMDANAADITGGASGFKGVEVECFTRSGDTDEDLALVQKFSFDSTTEAVANSGVAIAAGTYNFYARFKAANGALGPWAAALGIVIS